MSRPSPSAIRRRIGGLATVVLVAAATSIPTTALAASPADPVLVWNANAISVISSLPSADPPGLGNAPPLSPLHLAIVQGAIYDAVDAIDPTHEPYLQGLSAPSSASVPAAVAQAAHDVLLGLMPTTPAAVVMRVDDLLDASLDPIADGPSKTAGIEIGAEAAHAMLVARSTDGRFDNEPFTPSDALGRWRLVAPLSNNVFGQFATVTPLTIKSPDQFRTEGPPALTSAAYAAELNEVKTLGAQSGSSRTDAQTLLAGFATANPLLYMNKGLRDLAVARGLSTSQQARLFVMTSMAAADALIGCWNNKAYWHSWRPQTAIREAADDGNDATTADPDWLSLFASPGYPENPSGYNCYTGALWHSARLFFGTDKISFQLTSPGVPANAAVGNPIGVPGSTRSYTRLTDVIDDTIEGRILNGYHFRSADVQGAWLGKKVAQWVDKNYFGPVD